MLCQLSDCGKQPKYEEISCLTRERERVEDIRSDMRGKSQEDISCRSDINVL
jgi:hypothetical protein